MGSHLGTEDYLWHLTQLYSGSALGTEGKGRSLGTGPTNNEMVLCGSVLIFPFFI